MIRKEWNSTARFRLVDGYVQRNSSGLSFCLVSPLSNFLSKNLDSETFLRRVFKPSWIVTAHPPLTVSIWRRAASRGATEAWVTPAGRRHPGAVKDD